MTLAVKSPLAPRAPDRFEASCVPELGHTIRLDDDPQTVRYVRDVLTEAGYVPQVTGDPKAVGRLIREEKRHLVQRRVQQWRGIMAKNLVYAAAGGPRPEFYEYRSQRWLERTPSAKVSVTFLSEATRRQK